MGWRLGPVELRARGQVQVEVLKVLDQVAGLLEFEPLLISALFPFGEVLLADGSPAEPELENFLDLRQAIEPCDEWLAWLAVFEAAVQVVADVFGEPSDFAIASDHRSF